MDPTQEIDPQLYSRLPPYLDLVTTMALARKLIAAAPAHASPGARRTVVMLRESSDDLESFLINILRASPDADKRPVDVMTDRSWAALEMRLAAWLQMPVDDNHESAAEIAEAASIHSRLFPDGLRFTQLEYGAQWVEAEMRIKMIKEDRLEQRLAYLCGKQFVDELLRCHEMYGTMVGATAPSAPTESGRNSKKSGERMDAATLRKRVQQAILAHQLQLVAMCMSGDSKEAAAAPPGAAPGRRVPREAAPGPPHGPARGAAARLPAPAAAAGDRSAEPAAGQLVHRHSGFA